MANQAQQPPQQQTVGAPLPPPTPTGHSQQPSAQQQRPAGEPQNLNQIVIEYLNKKGYTRTEAMLRQESSHVDTDGRPIMKKVEDYPDIMYERAYCFLRDWIDNCLDLYKPELRRLQFPIFVYSFLDLAAGGYVKGCRDFFERHAPEHENVHSHDIRQLSGISSPEHVMHSELAQLYGQNKYRITLTKTTFNLFIYHIQHYEDQGGDVINRLINDHIEIKINPAHPTTLNVRDEADIGEDEGILGHTPTRNARTGELMRVKLGPLPMDKEFVADVEERLQQEDAIEREAGRRDEHGVPVANPKTLLAEFRRIKREETEDSPMRDEIPLPPYKGADIEYEVRMIKESRARYNLGSALNPALPSCCMYTFHNTNDGLCCVDFSRDSTLVAGGFQESYVRVFSLKGEPLISAIPSENPQEPAQAPASRRLVGHSGPVYGVSFAPNNQYLLSCSEDRSVRLWSLDTYTGLVVYKGHDRPIWDVKFGPFGHYFATASHDNTARLWSTDHIHPLRIFAGHLSDVNTLAWHPNAAYLATGSYDKTVRLWDLQRGSSVRVFAGHSAPVMALAISPDGRMLASAADDATIAMWDIGSGKKLKTMRGHGKTDIYSLSFSAEGATLVSGGADNTVRVWNVHHGIGGQTPAELEPFLPGVSGVVAAPEGDGQGTTGAAVPGVVGVTATTLAGRKKKEIVATADHLVAYHSKRTPVYKVSFTPRNLVLAAGAYCHNQH